VKAQLPCWQLASAFSGARQGMQVGPQKFTSFWGTQVPLQSRWPAGQPPQTWLAGRQAPAQSFVPWGHSAPHLTPSQVALPPAGTGQGLHDAPQLIGLSSFRQVSRHRWKPALHRSWHLSPSQLATESGGVGQGEQDEPQALRLSGSTQMFPQMFFPGGQFPSQGASSGTHRSRHALEPAGHARPQRVPSHVAVPPTTLGQR
jgi:hypothetical protein